MGSESNSITLTVTHTEKRPDGSSTSTTAAVDIPLGQAATAMPTVEGTATAPATVTPQLQAFVAACRAELPPLESNRRATLLAFAADVKTRLATATPGNRVNLNFVCKATAPHATHRPNHTTALELATTVYPHAHAPHQHQHQHLYPHAHTPHQYQYLSGGGMTA